MSDHLKEPEPRTAAPKAYGEDRWHEVRGKEDWQAVCAALADFHDAIVREIVWLGPEWVGTDGVLRSPSGEDGLLAAVQRQPIRGDAPQSALFLFRSPSAFSLDTAKDVEPRMDPGTETAVEFGPLKVRAAQIWVRFPSRSKLGAGPFGLEDQLCLFLEDVTD